MQIHNLQRKTQLKRSVSVGRGGKRGKTSGRGTKGQNARAGRKKYPEIRDVIKRFPKLRGYAFSPISEKSLVVNVIALESAFNNGDAVNPKTLAEKGVIDLSSGTVASVKILGDGELTKKLTVSGCKFSAQAKEKIEKAGGTIVQ